MAKTGFPFKRALVTGGAGFVGSHLVQRLVALGVQTSVLDNFSSGFRENVPKKVRVFKGDVRDKEAVRSSMQNVDIVFHLAEYIPNIPGHVIRFSASKPREDLDVCVGGTLNVLEHARINATHFVLASTAAVYGSATRPLREDSRTSPVSSYGAAKLCAETYTRQFQRSYGLPVTIFRFFNIFGPRQRKYLMYDCLQKISRNHRNVEMLGNGREVRDYIHVADATSRVLALVRASAREPAPIFNIGTGIGRTTTEVVNKLAEKLGTHPTFTYRGVRWVGNINRLVADMSKTNRYYRGGFTDYEQCIESLIEWFKEDRRSHRGTRMS
jgi:UDP-glucose 4-epimerase